MSGAEGRDLAHELERYLHEHIPISSAMGVAVLAASHEGVRLMAPLEPNINHRSTVFGGSASAVAILAGWTLLHVRLGHGGRGSRIVIQRSTVDYRHPIDSDFEAVALPPQPKEWARFTRMLERRGRGRVDLVVELRIGPITVGDCTGTYVVLPSEAAVGANSSMDLSHRDLR